MLIKGILPLVTFRRTPSHFSIDRNCKILEFSINADASILMAFALPSASATRCCASNLTLSSLFFAANASCSAVIFIQSLH